jgi:acetyltransferase-like isoleucine patch superfamily enzyme
MISASRMIDRGIDLIRPHSQVGRPQVPVGVLAGWYWRKGAVPFVLGLVRAPFFGRATIPLFIGSRTRIEYARQIFSRRGVFIGSSAVINAYSKEGIHLSDAVTIRENAWIQCSSHPSNPGVGLWVGESTYIGPRVSIGVGGPIKIGANCTFISENHVVSYRDTHRHDVTRVGITVGDRTWLGHGVTILDGVTFGADTIVGAGAVVTSSFPAGSKIAGVPARQIS